MNDDPKAPILALVSETRTKANRPRRVVEYYHGFKRRHERVDRILPWVIEDALQEAAQQRYAARKP